MRSVTEAMREATSLLEAASVSIQFQRQCVFSSYRRRLLLCARHEWVSLARKPTVFSVQWQPEYSETALKASTECCGVRIFGITQISLCTSYTTRRPFKINYSIGKQVRKLRLYHIIATFQVFCSPLCPTTCLTLVSFVHTIGLGSHSTQPQPPFDFVRMHFFHNKI